METKQSFSPLPLYFCSECSSFIVSEDSIDTSTSNYMISPSGSKLNSSRFLFQ